MVTVNQQQLQNVTQAQMYIQQQRQALQSAREQVSQFQPRVQQTQQQLRQATMQSQAGIRAYEAPRVQAQQQAFEEIGAAETGFETQVAQYEPGEASAPYLDTAYQQVVEAVKPTVAGLQSEIQSFQQARLDMAKDGISSSESERYQYFGDRIAELQARLAPYENILTSPKSEAVKQYYSGQAEAQSQYEGAVMGMGALKSSPVMGQVEYSQSLMADILAKAGAGDQSYISLLGSGKIAGAEQAVSAYSKSLADIQTAMPIEGFKAPSGKIYLASEERPLTFGYEKVYVDPRTKTAIQDLEVYYQQNNIPFSAGQAQPISQIFTGKAGTTKEMAAALDWGARASDIKGLGEVSPEMKALQQVYPLAGTKIYDLPNISKILGTGKAQVYDWSKLPAELRPGYVMPSYKVSPETRAKVIAGAKTYAGITALPYMLAGALTKEAATKTYDFFKGVDLSKGKAQVYDWSKLPAELRPGYKREQVTTEWGKKYGKATRDAFGKIFTVEGATEIGGSMLEMAKTTGRYWSTAINKGVDIVASPFTVSSYAIRERLGVPERFGIRTPSGKVYGPYMGNPMLASDYFKAYEMNVEPSLIAGTKYIPTQFGKDVYTFGLGLVPKSSAGVAGTYLGLKAFSAISKVPALAKLTGASFTGSGLYSGYQYTQATTPEARVQYAGATVMGLLPAAYSSGKFVKTKFYDVNPTFLTKKGITEYEELTYLLGSKTKALRSIGSEAIGNVFSITPKQTGIIPTKKGKLFNIRTGETVQAGEDLLVALRSSKKPNIFTSRGGKTYATPFDVSYKRGIYVPGKGYQIQDIKVSDKILQRIDLGKNIFESKGFGKAYSTIGKGLRKVTSEMNIYKPSGKYSISPVKTKSRLEQFFVVTGTSTVGKEKAFVVSTVKNLKNIKKLGMQPVESDLAKTFEVKFTGKKGSEIVRLYTGTSSENIPNILQKGLKPTGKLKEVYLTSDIGSAKGFAARTVYWKGSPKPGTVPKVLEVNIPKSELSKLFLKRGTGIGGVEEVTVRKIPSKYISDVISSTPPKQPASIGQGIATAFDRPQMVFTGIGEAKFSGIRKATLTMPSGGEKGTIKVLQLVPGRKGIGGGAGKSYITKVDIKTGKGMLEGKEQEVWTYLTSGKERSVVYPKSGKGVLVTSKTLDIYRTKAPNLGGGGGGRGGLPGGDEGFGGGGGGAGFDSGFGINRFGDFNKKMVPTMFEQEIIMSGNEAALQARMPVSLKISAPQYISAPQVKSFGAVGVTGIAIGTTRALTQIKAPVMTMIKSPVMTMIKSPVMTMIKSPVMTMIKSPVMTMIKSPVMTMIKSPTMIMTKAPVMTMIKSPVMTMVKTQVMTQVKAPVTVQAMARSMVKTPTAVKPIIPRPIPRILYVPLPGWMGRRKTLAQPKAPKPETGYTFQVRRRKKYEAPLAISVSKETAFALGARKTMGEAVATFKIVPTYRRATPTQLRPSTLQRALFRPGKKPGEFVQKERFRIVTPGEVRQISYKGAAARRGGSKKGKWF